MNNLDSINKLIKMANQIGTFFESFPDREEALDGIANHLKKFWTPAMRQTLVSAIEVMEANPAYEANELRSIVKLAISKHRITLVTEPSP